MRKKSGSSKSKLMKIALSSLPLAAHFLSAQKGLYKCSKAGCDGTLNFKFACNKCGQRSTPNVKRS